MTLALAASFVWAPVSVVGQDIEIPPHWSPYTAPTSYPEGTRLHIIQRGDTLWDLSNEYLENPFLWPQLWDANRYIQNPNLIYPGDPVEIPDLDMIRGEGDDPTRPGGGRGPGGEGGPGGGMGPGGTEGMGPSLYPAYEEISIQCAGYVPAEREDESFNVFGSEEGENKVNLATGDILYLNRGSADGVSPGDVYYLQRREGQEPQLESPYDWESIWQEGRSGRGASWNDETRPGKPDRPGYVVERTGWVTVLAVQANTAIAEVTQACSAINVGDYLKPFEPIPVPLLAKEELANRLSPISNQMRGQIIASLDDVSTLGQGYLVSIDVGEEAGVIPGNVFTIFRYLYPDAPRKVLGELAILTVQRNTATARITQSYDFVDIGDQVELK